MSGPTANGLPFQVTFAPNSFIPSKRKRTDENIDIQMKENTNSTGSGGTGMCRRRHFLSIPGGNGVFQTEEWKEQQSPMYHPIIDNLLINTKNIEQFSFTTGSWFLADQTGNYCGSREGNIINLWRYNEEHRRLYISRSILFTDNIHLYNSIRRQLEEL